MTISSLLNLIHILNKLTQLCQGLVFCFVFFSLILTGGYVS